LFILKIHLDDALLLNLGQSFLGLKIGKVIADPTQRPSIIHPSSIDPKQLSTPDKQPAAAFPFRFSLVFGK
jgi:hypothetical protein